MKPELKMKLELNSQNHFEDVEDLLQDFVKRLQLNITFSRFDISTFSFNAETKQINITLNSI